ncbi:MAG: hypothetical protein IKV94_05475 [Clostridia bacterium]|nr:hypothetical protein [Clostridia bacterium]
MKKRENILISFCIACIIVMGVVLIDAIIDTIKTHNFAEGEAKKYYVGGSEGLPLDLTEEGKEEVKEELNYWEDIINNASYEDKMAASSMEFYIKNVSLHYGMAETEEGKLYLICGSLYAMIILFVAIYYIISVELKSKKQYFVQNIKMLFSFIILFALINVILYVITALSIKEFSLSEIIYSMFGMLPVSIFAYIITAIINLIVNLIKNRKKNKLLMRNKKPA